MKITQELPRDQVAHIYKALKLYQTIIDITPDHSNGCNADLEYLRFDLVTLMGMITGKVVCEFTQDQFDEFTQNNGVDFPEYTISLK